MDGLIEAALSLLLPDISGRSAGSMPLRHVRRLAGDLHARLAEADAAGQPLICEIPAMLRVCPPSQARPAAPEMG